MKTLPLSLTISILGASFLAADWPKWRGPLDNGMASGDAPLEWSETTNIKWKVEIPGRGHSSPVVWGDKIFVTTAIPIGKVAPPAEPAEPRRGPGGGAGPLVEHKFDTICLDRRTGKILWQKTARLATPHEGFHRQYGSFASNSPVTDGKHVFSFFGSRGIFAYDLDGKLIWQKDFDLQMKMKLQFGEGTAPVLDGNVLILNFDQETGSFIATLDKNTGKELWRMPRDEQTSWAAPLVVTHNGRKQIIVSATKKVRSYDYATGKLLWECGGLGANTIPAPVYHDGVVYVMSGFRDPNLLAIRLGKEGDLTGSDSIVWTNTRGNSYTPSPVLYEGKLYMLTDNGMLSCLDARTGQPHYLQVRLPKAYNFKASPVGVNGKLYLATEDGDVVVVKMGEKFEVLATNSLPGQMFIATPAITGGEIFLRGQNTLFCVRKP